MFSEKISIIVRTKNSSNIIDQTLKALFSQTFVNFDLIIVDSGSTDDTLNKCLKYQHTLMLMTSEEYHPGRVLNKTLHKCSNRIVVFLNSDCVMLLPNTLQLLLNEMEDDSISAAFSRQVSRPEALSWVKRDYEIAFPTSEKKDWMHFSLPLAAIKKSVWQEVPFYTQAWASEDTKWAVDIKKLGYKINYAPSSLVMHSHNYTLAQLYNRKYVEGEADAYIYNMQITLLKTLKNYIGSIYHDFIFHLKCGDVFGFINAIGLRGVAHFSYLKGNWQGMKRKNNENISQTFGNYQQG